MHGFCGTVCVTIFVPHLETTNHCVAFLGGEFEGRDPAIVGDHVQRERGVCLCITGQEKVHHLAGDSPVGLQDQEV